MSIFFTILNIAIIAGAVYVFGSIIYRMIKSLKEAKPKEPSAEDIVKEIKESVSD